jgi:hypothetical protein
MAGSRTTFQKRQKELARKEKARDKMAKRLERKVAGKQPLGSEEDMSLEPYVDPMYPPDEPGSAAEPPAISAERTQH